MISVCAQIAIPTPLGISVTLQTFAIALCGYCLPLKYALLSYSTYVLLGIVGVPVFASFTGGLGVVSGKSGGYILGFIAIALLCSVSNKFSSFYIAVVFGIFGTVICHICGVAYLSIVSCGQGTSALLTISIPLLIKDIASIIPAKLLSKRIIRIINR